MAVSSCSVSLMISCLRPTKHVAQIIRLLVTQLPATDHFNKLGKLLRYKLVNSTYIYHHSNEEQPLKH